MHVSVLDEFEHRHFTFEERHCPACAAQQKYGRVVADRDDQATPKDKNGAARWDSPRTPRPDDGRHIYIREMTPAEVEARRAEREGRNG